MPADDSGTETDLSASEPASEPKASSKVNMASGPDVPVTHSEKPKAEKPPRAGLKELWHRFIGNKKLWIPTAIAAVLLLVLAIPATRYPVVGAAYKRSVKLQVVDADSSQPISDATVKFAGQSQLTDNQGVAVFSSIKPGSQTLEVSRQYYDNYVSTQFVGILGKADYSTSLKAAGITYTLTVQNLILKTPIANVLVRFSARISHTDPYGRAVIVEPAIAGLIFIRLEADGYTSETFKVELNKNNPTLTLALAPLGKLYYLSNVTGKINVMKANLDGSYPKVVLAGTGAEREDTELLPSPDWQNLILISRRSGLYASVYQIKTANDKLQLVDEGNATFTAIGWVGGSFIYEVDRNDLDSSQSGSLKLKSYNPVSGQLTTFDQAIDTHNHNVTQYYQTYLLHDSILFIKAYNAYPDSLLGARNTIVVAVNPDGSGKQTLKSVLAQDYFIDVSKTKPNEVYLRFDRTSGAGSITYYKYDSSVLSAVSYTDDEFFDPQPSYILSPSGNATLWSEERDGKNSIFLGDGNGDNAQQINRLEDLVPYGWYTEDYFLFSKNASQLYIGAKHSHDPVKVTDYYRPGYGAY